MVTGVGARLVREILRAKWGTGTNPDRHRFRVVGTLARLLLDEDHQRLGQNPIVLHGLGGSP